MHIAEGFLPATHAVAWAAVSAPFVIHGAIAATKTIKKHPDAAMLLGAAGAFTFVLSALKIPSVTGSTSHPTGTGLGAVLFKPPVMAFIGTVVLLFQALLLAHGGITTLGANVFSMAIVGPWLAYGVFISLRKAAGILWAVFFAAVAADLGTYIVTAFQLALAHPSAEGGFAGSLATFMGIFALTQIPLAIIEGILTVLVVRALLVIARSELLQIGFLQRAVAPQATPGSQQQEVAV